MTPQNAATRPPPRLRLHLAEWLGLWLLLLALGGYIAYSEYMNYRQDDANENSRLTSQAQVVEKALVAQVVAADWALQGLREAMALRPSNGAATRTMEERLQLISGTLTGASTVLITNASGKIIHSSVASLVGFDASGRDYFQQALKQRRPDTLFVTPPFTSALGKTSIALVREITTTYGEFDGVVLAALDPAYISKLLESIRFTPDTTAALLHGDGKVFVTSPVDASLIGKDLAVPQSFFTQHRTGGQAAGLFSGVTYMTGDVRMIAYQTVQPPGVSMDKPLVVAVLRVPAAIHAAWLARAIKTAWLYAALCVMVCTALLLHQRRRLLLQRLDRARESALRASEARLRSFFEATPDALLISDVNGTITMANQQVEVLLGYSMEELVGMSVEKLVPMRSRGGHPKLRDGFAATPQARRMGAGMGTKALRKDGSECYVEVSLNRIETDEGQFFASALRDVSVLRHSQGLLKISDQALKSISQGVIITDAQANIISSNDSFVEITGFSKTEIIGHNCRFLHGADTDPQTINEIRSALAVGSRFSGEILNYRKGGTPFWNDLAISPVYDEAGKLTHYIGVTRDVTSRRKTKEQIQMLAYYDQLTGLPNRTLLADRLKQTIAASSRNSTTGALLFIDLDRFKILNDTQGHDMGDMQLKQVAARLSACVREGDTVARVGGDEFVVILAGLSEDEIDAASDTEAVATKILAILSQPYQMDHVIHHSSASIGATLFRGTGTNIDDLMRQSDIAMYRAEDAGRNAVRFFDPSMEIAVVQRAALESDLRNGLAQQEFVLHYQAQVEGAGGVSGAEALVRWHHPQRGMVSPAEFIPLAEESGVILALGHWVLETACNQLEKWARVPSMAHLSLAVNVSAVQFAQSNFVEQVMAVVQRAGANPQRLKLELTEGLLVANVDDTIGKMRSLKASGIGFSLDDFGTGYSSLAYLSRLPLDQLKIDKSFVNDVVTNPDDAAIARTIIALARSLRLGVIAEGVETGAQREFLASAGCHAYQGYFFSRPLPLEGFEAFVRSVTLPNGATAMGVH